MAAKHLDLQRLNGYLDRSYSPESGGYRSRLGGPVTLYATTYALLSKHYLGAAAPLARETRQFILNCQDAETGFFVGPELADWRPAAGAPHDFDHLRLHLTGAVLPVLQLYGLKPLYPLAFATHYLDAAAHQDWLGRRDGPDFWLESNNLLLSGQVLVYLRDVEGNPAAQAALQRYFAWASPKVDPSSGLWGLPRAWTEYDALYGSSRQLLLYFHECQKIAYAHELIDSVLRLQYRDGGFAGRLGGGACEDVDAVDILVNLYKLCNHRRAEIRTALRRVYRLIAQQQNPDGGLPYRLHASYIHMGIPDTASGPGESNLFPTWFKLHTLALIAEILTDELGGLTLCFNPTFSVGWHRAWERQEHPVTRLQRLAELPYQTQAAVRRAAGDARYLAGRAAEKLARMARDASSPQ